jgi:AcrR family transcriptional regulator
MAKADTRARLISAARELVTAGSGPLPSAGAVANRAGVSRLTVYHHFGSHAGLLAAVAAAAGPPLPATKEGSPRERLLKLVAACCRRWASDPALFRRLPEATSAEGGEAREIAAALADADQLRPGCSLREAEDVIEIATSFAAFDRLHHDGRRSPAAVAEILNRVAASVLS